jgi:hypothetical protein
VGVVDEKSEGGKVKTCNEFHNDPMKMLFKYKTRMKVNHRIKNIKMVIL